MKIILAASRSGYKEIFSELYDEIANDFFYISQKEELTVDYLQQINILPNWPWFLPCRSPLTIFRSNMKLWPQ